MKKRVLIVEDDPSFAEFLDVTVRAAGYETVTAHDGDKALRLFEEQRPDLVFLDLLVPKKDGHAICQEIRSAEGGEDVPVVVLTGIYKKLQYREAARRDYGVTDYLTKPVRIVDLWDVLGRYLEGGAGEQGTDLALHAGDASEIRQSDLFQGCPVSERPLASALSELNRQRRTGLLFLKNAGNVLILYLDMGEVVFARSNDPATRLGAILTRKGLVTQRDVESAEELMSKGNEGLRMGEVLVAMNCLTQEDLEREIREHLEELVLEAFRGPDWKAQFVEGELPNEEEIRIHRSTAELILLGVREMGELERIRPHLPKPSSILAITRNGREMADGLGLTPYEEKMLSLCDGTRTLRKIVGIASLAPVEIERLLFAFLQCGIVESIGSAREDVSEIRMPVTDVKGAAGDAAGGEEPEGSLRDRLLPAVIMELHRARRTGVLEVKRGEDEAWLYFDNGILVFAGSNEQSSRIGEILIESRLVTEEEVGRVARAGKEDGRNLRLGQRLVEEGLVSLEELSWAITLQMQKRVQSLFNWSSGTWSFRAGDCPTDEPITLGFETVDVVLEGIRRMDPELLESRLPRPEMILKPATSTQMLLDRLSLTSDERRILARVRKGQRLGQLLSGSEFESDALRRGLYVFLTLGALTVVAPRSFDEEADDALGFLEDAPKVAPRPRKKAAAAAAQENGDMVPKVLLDQSIAKQQEMRKEMFDLYQSFEELKKTVASLRDEILTLQTSPLYTKMEPTVRDTVGTILEEYLSRLETTVH